LPERPTQFIIEGQVSLPDDSPAARVRVRLSSPSGISREAITNDNGRYAFTEVLPGSYSLTANSLTDPPLVSDPVQTDTSNTITESVSVDISLRAATAVKNAAAKPSIITIAEAEQKVPKDALKAFKQGLKLRSDNQPDKALASISQAIKLYPEYFQALAQRGDIYISMRKLDEAAMDFERALKVNAGYGPALRGAGYCKLEGGDYAQAARYLNEAARAVPDNASTLLLLGIANLELNEIAASRQALQKALAIDSSGAARAHIYLGKLYAREHQYQQAADELHLYLETAVADPDRAELRKIEAQWRAIAQSK
jgi:tetratricopeptide (TPR) repeat protein